MKKYDLLILSLLLLFLAGCSSKDKRNLQFMADTDMYKPVGEDAYRGVPPAHTIKRGWMPFPYPNTPEGYEQAKETLRNPLQADTLSLEGHFQEGQNLYNIYCALCHGLQGDGKGILVEHKKFLGVPSYKDRILTQGSIYYVMYYGRNAMGAYTSQLSEKERWQVALYVEALRQKLLQNNP